MLIDKTKKYQTRAGHPVIIYNTEGVGRYPVHGAYFVETSLYKDNEGWYSRTWTADGKYESAGQGRVFHNRYDNRYDLIEVEEENWAYFLLYELGKCEYQYGFTSKESAMKAMEDIKLAIENYNETAVSSSYRRLIRADLIKIKNTRSESE